MGQIYIRFRLNMICKARCRGQGLNVRPGRCVLVLALPSLKHLKPRYSSVVLECLIKAQLQDAPCSSTSSILQQMDRHRVTIFLGVCQGITVYVTQRILLNIPLLPF